MEKQKDEQTAKAKSIGDLQDIIENCARKISFLRNFTAHNVPLDELFSESGIEGFYQILANLEDDLKFVVDELSEKRQKGLIIEKEVSETTDLRSTSNKASHIRRAILQCLANENPNYLEIKVLQYSLSNLGYTITKEELRSHIEDLEKKRCGLIEFKKGKTGIVEIEMVKVTPDGLDFLAHRGE